MIAVLLRKRTSEVNRLIAGRLVTGHSRGLSRLLEGFQKNQKKVKRFDELKRMLQ